MKELKEIGNLIEGMDSWLPKSSTNEIKHRGTWEFSAIEQLEKNWDILNYWMDHIIPDSWDMAEGIWDRYRDAIIIEHTSGERMIVEGGAHNGKLYVEFSRYE
jgi:hypothetical protein